MGGQAKKQGGVAPGSRQGGTGMMGGAVAQPATPAQPTQGAPAQPATPAQPMGGQQRETYAQGLQRQGFMPAAQRQQNLWQQQSQQLGVPMHQLQGKLSEMGYGQNGDFRNIQLPKQRPEGGVLGQYGRERASLEQMGPDSSGMAYAGGTPGFYDRPENRGWGPPGGMPSPAQARLDALRGNSDSQRAVDMAAGPGSAFSTQGQQSIQQQQARRALDQYNQFNQMGQQFVDSQPFNPQLQQQFRQAQDAGYQQMKQQNPGAGIDQNTFEGFQLTNQMRAAKPQTNAGGWNDNARARERAQQFAQMTPEQFAERQRIIAGYQRER